tara:strand:+ start:2285 stop:2947 length:663 start_codon:yes stop_codon:yes gene_type:complete
MPQKSEKKIWIKLKNLVLKKIFSELILTLNEEIDDFQFEFIDSFDSSMDLPAYFITDEESIMQLIDEDISKKIQKIFLLSKKSINKQKHIEIINYDLPFKFINFIDYIIRDLRQNVNKLNNIISLNTLNYDKSSRQIFSDTISLILTEKENEIFNFLLNSKTSVSKNSLLKKIWKYSEGIDTHTLETHIYSLRKKLEKELKVKNILEHKEKGYYLNSELL